MSSPAFAIHNLCRSDACVTLPDTQANVQHYADMLEQLLLKRMQPLYPAAIAKITEIILPLRQQAIDDVLNTALTRTERNQRAELRKEQYEAFYDTLFGEPEVRQHVIEAQARMQEIASIARKQCTVQILKAEQGDYGSSADDMSFTLMHFRKQKVVAVDVQRYLDELSATFSLTSHPTNSTGVRYTQAAIALECCLANDNASYEDLLKALDEFAAAPVAAPRKTPIEELQEIIPIFDNLYDACIMQKNAIDTALQISGYADEGVHIRTPMMQLEDWSATFDGDGNPNATADAMRAGVQQKREWIKQRYLADLKQCMHAYTENTAYQWLCEGIQRIKSRLRTRDYKEIASCMADIESLQENATALDGVRVHQLDDLLYRMSIFGFHGSKGNIRHDAASLHNALRDLACVAAISIPEDKDTLSDLLTIWFEEHDGATLKTFQNVLANHFMKLKEYCAQDDTTVRIIERMRYLAEAPDIANKLIIAEATHPADAKAAMVLLHITGNYVAHPKATQEIVMLVESVADVRNLTRSIKSLAYDRIFVKHIRAIGRITVMIAHSDNRRRDGYSAGEVITKAQGKVARMQRELWEQAVIEDIYPLRDMADAFGVPIFIFDGGGNDLMRGAAVNPAQMGKQHGHAASRENAPTIRNPQNTIQGEQTRLLFGYPQCAAMFLEMMVSQTMYAKAATEHRIGAAIVDEHGAVQVTGAYATARYQQSQDEAQRSAVVFHDVARKTFHHYTDKIADEINPFDHLYAQSGAWISTLLANRSSRSNQRGEQLFGATRTVTSLRGNKTALSQRAITGNLLFQLTGTFHLGLLGQLEAFEAIGASAAHQMFHASLPDRTHIVGAAQQLQMTDFDKAWRMMGKPHPKRDAITKLAELFRIYPKDKVPEPEITLAFMEDYGTRLAKKIFAAATGKDADSEFIDPDRPFTIRDAYRTLLPILARQIDLRHARHEAENVALAHQERMYNSHPDIEILPMLENVSVALVGALAHDIRPALGPLAVRGAKGIATTRAEKALDADEVPQPDIRDALKQYDKGVQSAWREDSNVAKKMRVPAHVCEAFSAYNIMPIA
jgi:phosphoenolpyruvate carboxylase